MLIRFYFAKYNKKLPEVALQYGCPIMGLLVLSIINRLPLTIEKLVVIARDNEKWNSKVHISS